MKKDIPQEQERVMLYQVLVRNNVFDLSSTKLPIYSVFQKTKTTYSFMDNYRQTIQRYVTVDDSLQIAPSLYDDNTRVGFFVNTEDDGNYLKLSNFKFKGSIYTGDYVF